MDDNEAPYSIHQFALCVDEISSGKKAPGTWVGPHLVSHALRRLVAKHSSCVSNIRLLPRVHVASDATLYVPDLIRDATWVPSLQKDGSRNENASFDETSFIPGSHGVDDFCSSRSKQTSEQVSLSSHVAYECSSINHQACPTKSKSQLFDSHTPHQLSRKNSSYSDDFQILDMDDFCVVESSSVDSTSGSIHTDEFSSTVMDCFSSLMQAVPSPEDRYSNSVECLVSHLFSSVPNDKVCPW